MSKKCCHQDCGITYENVEENFHKDKSREDGFAAWCKSCRKKSSKERYDHLNPKAQKNCMDCGLDITHLHTQRLRCDGCKTIHLREIKRLDQTKRIKQDPGRYRAINALWRKRNPERYKELMKTHNDNRNKIINN